MRQYTVVISLLIIPFLVIIGCAENPNTGSMLTLPDVEKYINFPEPETICLESNTDSACLKLTPNVLEIANVKVPVIHIHPQKFVYVFYHEGQQILRAERAVDTSDIVKSLTDGGGSGDQGGGGTPPVNPPPVNPPPVNPPPIVNNPSGNGGGGDDGTTSPATPVVNNPPAQDGAGTPPIIDPPPVVDPPPVPVVPPMDGGNGSENTGGSGNIQPSGIDAHHVHNDGWLIWINYDAPDAAYTLEGSGLTIHINGELVTNEDIRSFALVEGDQGRAVQFFYPTGETDDSTLTINVKGLTTVQESVSFKMNSPVETSPDKVTYQMTPL